MKEGRRRVLSLLGCIRGHGKIFKENGENLLKTLLKTYRNAKMQKEKFIVIHYRSFVRIV
jgi:hypothetical protein